MRLIEIAPQSNNKQQLNEFAFVPILIGMATAGLTLTDLWNYKKRYNAAGGGQAGWDAIKNDVYQDAAFIAAGGAVGKVIHLGYKSWKRAKDAKKAVGDSPKPLTNKEKSLAKKIDKITAKDTVTTRAAQKDAFNIPKIPPVWKRVNWSNAMRTLVAPFGSKAANDFRALPKEAQEIFLRRAANAKRAKKNQEIDAPREKIDKRN